MGRDVLVGGFWFWFCFERKGRLFALLFDWRGVFL